MRDLLGHPATTHPAACDDRAPDPRGLRRVVLAASLAIALLATGCSSGLNRRDEYYLIRELTFQPTPGDGSTIVVGRERDVLRAIADANRTKPRGLDD